MMGSERLSDSHENLDAYICMDIFCWDIDEEGTVEQRYLELVGLVEVRF